MKKQYAIKSIANWFFGNYCMRKCRDEQDPAYEHWLKLQELANKLEGTQMTHRQFLDMMRSDKTICNLSDEEWEKRKFSFKNDCVVCKRFGIRF